MLRQLLRRFALIVSIHQPAHLPWLGYFSRIAASDVFVFLDNVQFEKNSFTNRNRIKTPNGPLWLTIPVVTHGHRQNILDIRVDEHQHWQKKQLRSIEQNYRSAACFKDRFERLTAIYRANEEYLAEFCFRQLAFWLKELGISKPVVRASTLPVEGRKSDLLLELCRFLGATSYLSGPFGRNYLAEDKFELAGIKVEYQNYVQPVYPQLHGGFIPHLAVVDYWLNCADQNLFRSDQ
jgi:hypothetical protein